MCHSCEIKNTGNFQNHYQGACMMPIPYDNNIHELREDVYTCAMCGNIFLYKSLLALHFGKHVLTIKLNQHIFQKV